MPKPVKVYCTSKESIIAEAERIFEAADFGTDPAASCLYWSACVTFAATSFGRRLIVQAGTAHFLRIPVELDDGKPTTHTHFAYVWDDETAERVLEQFLGTGILPEMHVWAADPVTNEIVDLSTRFLPEQCRDLGGLDWLAPEPPRTLWAGAEKLPQGWSYTPTKRATFLAMALMRESALKRILEAVRH